MLTHCDEPADIIPTIVPGDGADAAATREICMELVQRTADSTHSLSALRIDSATLLEDRQDVFGNLGRELVSQCVQILPAPSSDGKVGHAVSAARARSFARAADTDVDPFCVAP